MSEEIGGIDTKVLKPCAIKHDLTEEDLKFMYRRMEKEKTKHRKKRNFLDGNCLGGKSPLGGFHDWQKSKKSRKTISGYKYQVQHFICSRCKKERTTKRFVGFTEAAKRIKERYVTENYENIYFPVKKVHWVP